MASLTEVGAAQSDQAEETFQQPPGPLDRFLGHMYSTYYISGVVFTTVTVVTGDVFLFRASHCWSFMFSQVCGHSGGD